MAVQELEKWSKFAVVNGVRTHYYDTGGDRDPLILLHGGGSAASMQWRYNISELGTSFRVIADDRLGFGLTEVPAQWNGTIAEHAEHEVALLKQIGIESAHICGLSQGSWRATYITLTYPKMVKKLILCTSGSITMPTGRDNSAQKRQAQIYPNREEIKAKMLKATKRPELVADELVDTIYEFQSRNFKIYSEQIWPKQFGGDPERRTRNLSIKGKHISEYMSSIKKPTLIVWGNDPLVPIDKGVWLLNTIPESQLYSCSGGHTPMFEHYEMFNTVVAAFIKEEYPYNY